MKHLLIFACLTALATARTIDPRIIGGNPAIAGQFPFAAAIHITTSDGMYFCGGTLIGSQWLVTAAQCVDGGIHFSVQLGSNNLSGNDTNRVIAETSNYFQHPDYNPLTLENDIALIKLRSPLFYTDYLRSIYSLADEELESGTIAAAIGWGQTSDSNAGLSDRLIFASVTTLSNEECKLTYGNQITDQMVCVDGNYNEGACNGDIGGPLVHLVLHGTAKLVGVSSFLSGNGCESPDPSGYTRVFPYIDWIRTTIAAN